MDNLHFYSSRKSTKFLTYLPKTTCFLGACTAQNLALGIDYFSNSQIKTFSPYDTIFNAPSLLKDLEIIAFELNHHILIDTKQKVFYDEVRFWNRSESFKKVTNENLQIDTCVKRAITESDLLIVSLGSVEMWSKSEHVMNRLPKISFSTQRSKMFIYPPTIFLTFLRKLCESCTLSILALRFNFQSPMYFLKLLKNFKIFI